MGVSLRLLSFQVFVLSFFFVFFGQYTPEFVHVTSKGRQNASRRRQRWEMRKGAWGNYGRSQLVAKKSRQRDASATANVVVLILPTKIGLSQAMFATKQKFKITGRVFLQMPIVVLPFRIPPAGLMYSPLLRPEPCS